MTIEKYHPSPALAPFIKEFLILESDVDVINNTIPNTSLVMSFRYRGNVLLIDGDKKDMLPANTVAGLRRVHRHFYYMKGTANILVIFNEGGINAFTRVPAHKLFGLSISCDNLFPKAELGRVLERLEQAVTNSCRIDVIEAFLKEKAAPIREDRLVASSVHLIKQHKGIVRIKKLASSLHISHDAFEKRFRACVGSTPRQYASIVRLRYLIDKFPTCSSLTEAAHEAGYFDQSHFIKDFRLFTGKTPTEFFKSSMFW